MTDHDSDRLLTGDEVAARLRFRTRQAFDSWRSRQRRQGSNTLPAVKLPGGRVRFREADVDALIDDHLERR